MSENNKFCKEIVLGSISVKYCMDCGSWNKLNVIDDSVQDEWGKNNPEQYKKYINDVTSGKCVCPLCRKKSK